VSLQECPLGPSCRNPVTRTGAHNSMSYVSTCSQPLA
jgi:hypothetical protein